MGGGFAAPQLRAVGDREGWDVESIRWRIWVKEMRDQEPVLELDMCGL